MVSVENAVMLASPENCALMTAEEGSNKRLASQAVAFKVQIGTYSLQKDESSVQSLSHVPQICSDWTELVLPKVSVMSDLPPAQEPIQLSTPLTHPKSKGPRPESLCH